MSEWFTGKHCIFYPAVVKFNYAKDNETKDKSIAGRKELSRKKDMGYMNSATIVKIGGWLKKYKNEVNTIYATAVSKHNIREGSWQWQVKKLYAW